LSDGQVHLPVRLLAKDLVGGGMPVVRYAIEYVAAKLGTKGELRDSDSPPTMIDFELGLGFN
jgi:hypothetical protein